MFKCFPWLSRIFTRYNYRGIDPTVMVEQEDILGLDGLDEV